MVEAREFDGVGGDAVDGVIGGGAFDFCGQVEGLEKERAFGGMEGVHAGEGGGEAGHLDGGAIEDAADARVGVLDIEDGVLVTLASGEIEVEVEGGVVVPHEIEEAGDISADAVLLGLSALGGGGLTDFVDQVDDRVDVSVAFAHGSGLAVFEEADELIDLNEKEISGLLEGDVAGAAIVGIAFKEEGGHDSAEAADIAVMVGAEDSDEVGRVGGAVQLVLVVGDVAGDIGEASISAPEDAVLVVAEEGAPEPERGFGSGLEGLRFGDESAIVAFGHPLIADGFGVGDTGFGEGFDGGGDGAGIVEGLFGEPGFEVDTEGGQIFFLLGEHEGLGLGLPPGDVGVGALFDTVGDSLDVIAFVAVFGEGEVECESADGFGEEAHLLGVDAVIDVVLAVDLVSGGGEDVAEGAAVCGAAPGADGDGAVRVDGDEFDVDAAGLGLGQVGEGVAFGEGGLETGGEGVRGEGEIDESGAGDFDFRKDGAVLELRDELFGEGAGVGAGETGGLECEIAGEIAVFGVFRGLDVQNGEFREGLGGKDAVFGQALDCDLEGFQDGFSKHKREDSRLLGWVKGIRPKKDGPEGAQIAWNGVYNRLCGPNRMACIASRWREGRLGLVFAQRGKTGPYGTTTRLDDRFFDSERLFEAGGP